MILHRSNMILPAAWCLSEVSLPPPWVTIGRPTSTSSHPTFQSEISNRFITPEAQGLNALQPIKQWIANGKMYKAGQLIYFQYSSLLHTLSFILNIIRFHTVGSFIKKLVERQSEEKAPIIYRKGAKYKIFGSLQTG